MFSNNKIAIGIVVVAVLVGAGAIVLLLQSGKGSVQQVSDISKEAPPTPPVSNNIYVAFDQLPTAIPADLPIEKNATILQNYRTQDTTQEKQQSVRMYETAKTLSADFADFTNYFKKNGWTTSPGSIVDTDSVKSMTATKNLVTLKLMFNSNSTTKKNTVTITADYFVGKIDPTKTYPAITVTPGAYGQ